MLNFRNRQRFASRLLRVNYKAELWVTCYLTRGIPNFLYKNRFPGKIRQGNCSRGTQDSAQADSGYAQANLGRAQDAQALLRMLRLCSGCSGSAQALLRLAQALLRHTHPRLRYAYPRLRLKQQLLTSAD
jgi:hypothetical protein